MNDNTIHQGIKKFMEVIISLLKDKIEIDGFLNSKGIRIKNLLRNKCVDHLVIY